MTSVVSQFPLKNADAPTVATSNRREFLQQGLATTAMVAGGAFATGRVAAEDQPGDEAVNKPGWIDAHSHIWTRDVKRFPLANNKTVADLDPPSFNVDELFQQCEPFGVDRVVLIQHHTYHGWDNSYLVDAARRFPKRFRVVAMVDDAAPHPDVAMKKLLKQRVTGFRITSWIRGKDKWLEGAGMDLMWKTAAKTRQNMCGLVDAADLPGIDRMCAKHPDTPVVIDHFARIGVDGTIRAADVKALCNLAKHKHVTLKISAYYALGKKQAPYHDLIPMIRQVYDAFGPERLMWASDSPYQVVKGHTYQSSIELVRDGLDFVSKTDREWLLRKTAERVYFFDA
ncbi:MAG: amidohydrolase family protein [Planctomycetota bacterium]|nr:amidohydrolase family protein [Planctomycetota bacterium]